VDIFHGNMRRWVGDREFVRQVDFWERKKRKRNPIYIKSPRVTVNPCCVLGYIQGPLRVHYANRCLPESSTRAA
jgi:hypothetical protein